ncbi:hypothetical protein M5X16_00005, partial [Paenibacillus chitinolyticus]
LAGRAGHRAGGGLAQRTYGRAAAFRRSMLCLFRRQLSLPLFRSRLRRSCGLARLQMPGKPVAQPAHRAAPGAAPPRPHASLGSQISCEPPVSQVSIATASLADAGFLM